MRKKVILNTYSNRISLKYAIGKHINNILLHILCSSKTLPTMHLLYCKIDYSVYKNNRCILDKRAVIAGNCIVRKTAQEHPAEKD